MDTSPQRSAPAADDAALRVERVLATLVAGARLRQAERAVLASADPRPAGAAGAGRGAALDPLLVELRQREFVHEPVAFSPRAGIGRLLVLARKAMFKLFMKWYLHPLLQQQNAFNQTASRALAELAAGQDRLRADLATLVRSPRRDG
jgi:hypothetical protein